MGEGKKAANLSKSKFISGLQCLKRLYLSCYERKLAMPPDEATQAAFERGQEVGELAREAFPGGVLVDEEYWDHDRAIAHTRRLMADESVPAIFEGAFTHENIIIRADVLERMAGSMWRLIEVKSSTASKDVHFRDLAVQEYVLKGCGVDVAETCLMHLNREYVYDGQRYQLNGLFRIDNLTWSSRALQERLPGQLAGQRAALRGTTAPDIAPGPQCADPYTCEFYDYCNEALPDDHVRKLYGIRADKVNRLLEMGIESIAAIPDTFPLYELQRRMVTCVKSNRPYFDAELQKELAQLRYPLCFMDFETVNPALPRHAGTRPYTMFAFQWSVHAQESPGAEPKHYEFLADNAADPRKAFLTSLLETVERHGGGGHIVVYNESFERRRLNDLAEWFPEYGNQIAHVQDRIWDFLAVIRQNVYHPGFNYSFSLKNVLAALVPGMTYEGMRISDGEQAGLAYERMIHPDTPDSERARVRRDLLAYCKQDTLAMVKLLASLNSKRYPHIFLELSGL